MVELSEFAKEWKERYLSSVATYNHIERLKNIGRLTDYEFKNIIVSKKNIKKYIRKNDKKEYLKWKH